MKHEAPLAFGWESSAAVLNMALSNQQMCKRGRSVERGGGILSERLCTVLLEVNLASVDVSRFDIQKCDQQPTAMQTSTTICWLLGPGRSAVRPHIPPPPPHTSIPSFPHLLVTEPQGVAASTRRRRLDRPGREGEGGLYRPIRGGGENAVLSQDSRVSSWNGSTRVGECVWRE